MSETKEGRESEALLGRGGLSPRYWGEAHQLQRERIEEDYRALIELPGGTDEHARAFRRLQLDIHFLLIASGHLLRCLNTCAEVLDDETIREIREDFDERAPFIKHVRDVLEHLDEYTSGEGRLVKQGTLATGTGPMLVFEPLNQSGEIMVWLGTWKLPVLPLAYVGAQLGQRLAEAWEARFGSDEDLTVWGRSR